MWEDLGLTPGLGRSPGEGNGYPLQDSGLHVHGAAELDTTEQLSPHLPLPTESVCAQSAWLVGPGVTYFLLYTFIVQKCFLTAGEENTRAYKKLNYHTV